MKQTIRNVLALILALLVTSLVAFPSIVLIVSLIEVKTWLILLIGFGFGALFFLMLALLNKLLKANIWGYY